MTPLPEPVDHSAPGLTRRQALLGLAMVPSITLARSPEIDLDYWNRPREVWIQRQQTGESVREIYFADGQVRWDGYQRICGALRDITAGVTAQIDVVLLDALCGAQGYLAAHGLRLPWVATSGYRTSKTNAATEGAARDSQHVRGRATDGYFPGLRLDHQAGLASMYHAGGLGWYPARGFIHVDTGPVRAWKG